MKFESIVVQKLLRLKSVAPVGFHGAIDHAIHQARISDKKASATGTRAYYHAHVLLLSQAGDF